MMVLGALSLSCNAMMQRNRRISDEKPMTLSKSIGSPLLMADRAECDAAVAKTCGTKRALSECVPTPSRSNVPAAHIVYVRRKPETDLTKRKVCDSQRAIKSTTNQSVETTHKLDKSLIRASDVAPLSSSSFSPMRSSGHISPAENSEHGRLNSSTPIPEDQTTVNVNFWEERYCRLQNFLKMLDQSNQHEYVQMLRSLSSVELSGHAVELEKRSINLSTEEAKEIQRVSLFDVLGKRGKKVCKASSEQEQLQQK